MKALILLESGAQTQEVYPEYYGFQQWGWGVDVATPDGKPRTDKHGIEFKQVTKSFGDFCDVYGMVDFKKIDQYQVLYIPGGIENGERLRMNRHAKDITKAFHLNRKLLTSICHGPWLIVSAKLSHKGYRQSMVGYEGIKDDIESAGYDYFDNERVVTSNNIISAKHYNDTPQFMNAIYNYVYEGPMSETVQKTRKLVI